MQRRTELARRREGARRPAPDPRNVALVLPMQWHHARRITQGIFAALRDDPAWSLWPAAALSPRDLVDRNLQPYDAVIGFLTGISWRQTNGTHPPLVNTSNHRDCPIPTVISDDLAIGRMAANYLLGRGFQNFGYFGSKTHLFSQQRLSGYQRTLESARLHLGFSAEVTSAETALSAIDKPAAIFCENDWTAIKALRACLTRRIEVPGQIAILGVDNDELATYTTRLGLSSIEPDSTGIGRTAWAVLQDLLAGRPAPTGPVLLPPLRVIERESTANWAFRDQLVVRALKAMDLHAQDGWKVQELSDHLKVAKRTLDRRFAAVIGKTVHEALLERRLSHALQLIRSSSDTVETIAINSGFGDARTLYSALRRAGHPPPQQVRAHGRESGGLP